MSEQKVYRILHITFVGAIVALLVASGFLFASGERLRRWSGDAWKALYARDYDTAIVYYERYLRQRPYDSDAWGDLALAYFHVRRYDECIAALRNYANTCMSSGVRDDEEERQWLIRYVECVKAGEEFGEKPPRFFSWAAPEQEVEPGEVDDAVAD